MKDKSTDTGNLRTFETGATRDTAQDKLDFEAILSPLVLLRYVQYMNENKKQADGTMRAGDNWQMGIPKDAYIKSLCRHMMDLRLLHRGIDGGTNNDIEEVLCATIFNAMGYLFEILMERSNTQRPREKPPASSLSPEDYANLYKRSPGEKPPASSLSPEDYANLYKRRHPDG